MAEGVPFQDSALSAVPDGQLVGGFKVALVQASLGITLPVLMEGADIGRARGLPEAAVLFAGCCSLVAALALFTSLIGARHRLSTYAVNGLTFGRLGARPVNALTALVLAGWFASTAEFLGGIVQPATIRLGIPAGHLSITLVLLVATAAAGMFGFRHVERIASFVAPAAVAVLLLVAVQTTGRAGFSQVWNRPGDGHLGTAAAASRLVGLFMLAAVLAPDVARFTRTVPQALLSVLGMAVSFPLVLMLAALPAAALGTGDYLGIVATGGHSLMVLAVVTACTGVCNALNLYSCTLTLATIFTGLDTRVLGLGVTVVSALAVAAGVSRLFEPFLLVLSVAATPVAGVYVATLLFPWRRTASAAIDAGAFISWAAGCLVGGLGLVGHPLLTPLPATDSILAAFLVRCWLCALAARSGRGRSQPSSRTGTPP